MTLAERLIDKGLNEGLNQGLSQGLVQGRVQMLHANVIEVLELRFDAVPDGLKEAIRQIGDEAKLTHLHRAAVRCASIDAFAQGL